MMPNKNKQLKETTLNLKLKEPTKMYPHTNINVSNLLSKKPQILLMKWNHFLENYHHLKQLNDINSSLISICTHLNKKTEEPQIFNVPFIESEQNSMIELEEESFVIEKHCNHINFPHQLKASINTKGSIDFEGILKEPKVFKNKSSHKGSKITLSIKFKEKEKTEEIKKQNSNSSDEGQKENNVDSNEEKIITKEKKPFFISEETELTETLQVAEEMRKTACFSSVSFTETSRPCLSILKEESEEKVKILNDLKSCKNMLELKRLQTDEEKRRERVREILKEDEEYLKRRVIKNE